MDCCPICTETYFVGGGSSGTSECSSISESTADDRCSYVCDSGKQCKRSSCEGDDLCTLHVKQRIAMKCLQCQESCCKICYRTFFLQQFENPSCMHCKKRFDIEFLLGYDENKVQRFTPRFIWGPWKEHRENVLVDQIKARMPEFQPKASAELKVIRSKKLKADLQHRIRQIQVQWSVLNNQRRNLVDQKKQNPEGFTRKDELAAVRMQIKEYNQRIDKLRNHSYAISREINNEQYFIEFGRYPDQKDGETKTTNYVHRGKCPKENCNGFIEDKWACGICGDKICSKCMMPSSKDHKCKEEDVESVKYLRAQSQAGETKPCPACRTLVSKVSGCYQMWCVSCHTFFDWTKGTIIKNLQFVHNPEHDEWVRNNGGALGDDVNFPVGQGPCGLHRTHFNNLGISREDELTLRKIFRSSNELRDELARHQDPLERRIEKTCIDFLHGTINEEKLKHFVQRHYKAQMKEDCTIARRTMFADTVQQILLVALNKLKTAEDKHSVVVETVKSVDSLRMYTMDEMIKIGRIFNSQAPHISETEFIIYRQLTHYRPKTILNAIDSYRQNREYGGNFSSHIYNTEAPALSKLTKTKNYRQFNDFYRKNPDWRPSMKEVTDAVIATNQV